jgi:hypothetical protein
MRKLRAIAARLMRAEVKKSDRQSVLSIDDLMQDAFFHNRPNILNKLRRESLPTNFEIIPRTNSPKNENSPPAIPRPPKATTTTTTTTTFTLSKAINHIIIRSPQKTTHHRSKPRTLPPLSQPPFPRSIRTFAYSSPIRPHGSKPRTQLPPYRSKPPGTRTSPK